MRSQVEERVGCDAGVVQDQCALSEVAEDEAGQRDCEPGGRDRDAAEVPHVRVQRFDAGDAENHGAERDERDPRMPADVRDGVERVDSAQDGRVTSDPVCSKGGNGEEPDQHDRPEGAPDPPCAFVLEGEEQGQHDERQRHHELVNARGGDLRAFDCREDRDRGGDHAVAVEERDTDQPEQQHGAALPANSAPTRERHQRHHATLAVVVRTHHEEHVLDRDDDDQAPEKQREDAEDVRVANPKVVRRRKRSLKCVERTGADIAEDDTEGPERQDPQPGTRLSRPHKTRPHRHRLNSTPTP